VGTGRQAFLIFSSVDINKEKEKIKEPKSKRGIIRNSVGILGGKKVGEEDRRMDGHNHHMVYAYKEISQ
jgi:hypothetical protein